MPVKSGASAGMNLGRRLADVLLSWALAKPGDQARLGWHWTRYCHSRATCSPCNARHCGVQLQVQALNRQLDATYGPLARAGEEAVIAQAVHPTKLFEWRDDPWRLRRRADALERDRARLARALRAARRSTPASRSRRASVRTSRCWSSRASALMISAPKQWVDFGDDHCESDQQRSTCDRHCLDQIAGRSADEQRNADTEREPHTPLQLQSFALEANRSPEDAPRRAHGARRRYRFATLPTGVRDRKPSRLGSPEIPADHAITTVKTDTPGQRRVARIERP